MEPTNKESGGIYRDYVKRILDLVTASLAFLILSPLIAVFAVLVRIKLGSPVIFRQARAGRNEKIFYLIKFRSMTNAMDENGKFGYKFVDIENDYSLYDMEVESLEALYDNKEKLMHVIEENGRAYGYLQPNGEPAPLAVPPEVGAG